MGRYDPTYAMAIHRNNDRVRIRIALELDARPMTRRELILLWIVLTIYLAVAWYSIWLAVRWLWRMI